MTALAYISISISAAAAAGAVCLFWPPRRWRAALIPAALVLLAVSQATRTWTSGAAWRELAAGELAVWSDVAQVLLSLAALACVLLVRPGVLIASGARESPRGLVESPARGQANLEAEKASRKDALSRLVSERDEQISELCAARVAGEAEAARRQSKLENDLADCRRKSDLLRAKEARMRLIVETAMEAIVTIDPRGEIADWSPQAEYLFGWKKREVIGRHLEELIVPSEHQFLFRRIVQSFLESGEAKLLDNRAEATVCNRQGRRFPVELAVSALGIDGEFTLCLFIHEITQRKQAEDRLRDQQAELAHVARLSTMGELVAGIAHEINQPLQSIANFAAASKNALNGTVAPDTQKIRDWSEGIADETTRAGEIIRRMRNFIGNKDSHRSTVDLNEIVRESIALVAADARRKHVTIRTDLCPEELLHIGDRIQLQQVLVNLLRNACDAVESVSQEHRRVVVTTSRIEGDGIVEVQDLGAGIPSGRAEEIFKPFFTTKTQGMGMGLAVSRTIVDAHGGGICAAAGAPQGARFRVQLPLNREVKTT